MTVVARPAMKFLSKFSPHLLSFLAVDEPPQLLVAAVGRFLLARL